jgi:NAD(P)-dependent dehydrogenase (short-subunit alcohol dehydrogenase family)
MTRAPAGLLSLEGQVALVTGGSGGIGSAIVRLLLGAGATVVSVDLPGRATPPGAIGVAADLADGEAVQSLLAGIQRDQAALRLIVHCAGIARDAVLWKMSAAEWSEVMRVNLDSAFHLLHAGAPLLRRAGGGAVVLIASINAERGKFGQANYAASKAGLIGLARSAALELGRFGIRVNCVAPGWIETSLTAGLPEEFRVRALEETPLRRLGEPEDVARAVLFLCSDLSRHVTGQVLRVDGGQLMA